MDKKLWGFTAIALLIILVALGSYAVQKKRFGVQVADPALSLTTPSGNLKFGDSFSVIVNVNSKTLKINGADIRIKYDSTKLQATNIEPAGGFLPTIIIPGKIESSDPLSGKASIVLSCLETSAISCPKNGNGELAKINFMVVGTGTSTISFDNKTALSASGHTTNVVGSMLPLTVTGY